MRLHRFYIDPEQIELKQEFWLKDEALRNQWLRVLRYREGDQVVLFDGKETERLYKITKVDSDAVHLEMVTEFERKIPDKHIYLFFSLLKKDKNEWVLQKCTELGVRNFVPIIADRSEKTGFNIDRAKKIVTEASEQCGRSDIPEVREPILLEHALEAYGDKVNLFVCDETLHDFNPQTEDSKDSIGVFVGPEGGWTDSEFEKFKSFAIGNLNLGTLTLRAETATVTAIAKILHS